MFCSLTSKIKRRRINASQFVLDFYGLTVTDKDLNSVQLFEHYGLTKSTEKKCVVFFFNFEQFLLGNCKLVKQMDHGFVVE